MTKESKSELRIAFLDEDHVLGLVRDLLRAEPDDLNQARSFFVPEPVSPGQLEAVGAPLRARHPLDVSRGEDSLASALVFRRGCIDASMMDRMPRLRLIQRLGESSHMIDLPAARTRGIEVSCLPRTTLLHVAEHTLMLMLALARRLLESNRAVRDDSQIAGAMGSVAYNWTGITGIGLLSGKTLGIIGLGEIGQMLARRAQALGMRVLFANRSKVDEERRSVIEAQEVSRAELLQASDFVSVHVPGKSGRVIGADELALMRSQSFLINTSRGSLIDEDALYAALLAGEIAGAALDVHALEPRGRGDRFLTLPNIVLTPHIAGGSRLGVLDEAGAIFENLGDVLGGMDPRHARIA